MCTPPSRRLPKIAAAALAVAASLGLASCSALTLDDDYDWKTAQQMRADDAGDQVPSLVEPDSTDIRLFVPRANGTTLVSWQSRTGVVRDDCAPSQVLDADPPPPSPIAWWPADVPDRGLSCGWWRVFQRDGRYFAWQVHPQD